MGKIERKYMAHFINAAIPGTEPGTPIYERLGKDLEEYSPELSAQVDVKKNIMGDTSILISGYEKTGSVDTYYAESGSKLFDRLQDIIDNQRILDDLKADIVEVHLWEEASPGSTYVAYQEEIYIEVNSYGGDTTGYQIPFTVHYTGKRKKGTFDVSKSTFASA